MTTATTANRATSSTDEYIANQAREMAERVVIAIERNQDMRPLWDTLKSFDQRLMREEIAAAVTGTLADIYRDGYEMGYETAKEENS